MFEGGDPMNEATESTEKKGVFAIAHAETAGLIPRGVPGLSWHILFIAWIAFAAQTFLKMCVFAIQPVYAEEFGLGAFVVLMFPMVFTVMQAPLSPSLTHKTDRLGGGFSRRHMTIIVAMVCALAASLISFKTFSGTGITFIILVAICALFLGPGEPLCVEWPVIRSRWSIVALRSVSTILGILGARLLQGSPYLGCLLTSELKTGGSVFFYCHSPWSLFAGGFIRS